MRLLLLSVVLAGAGFEEVVFLIVDLAVSDALVTNIERLRNSRSPQVSASVPILPTPVVEIGNVKTGPCCTEPFHDSLSSRST